jgi:hypothetical protein
VESREKSISCILPEGAAIKASSRAVLQEMQEFAQASTAGTPGFCSGFVKC